MRNLTAAILPIVFFYADFHSVKIGAAESGTQLIHCDGRGFMLHANESIALDGPKFFF